MAVSIRVAILRLVNVDNDTGEIVDKNDKNTKMTDVLRSTAQFRVYRNGTGSAESPNAGAPKANPAVPPPTIEAYLEAEAGDNHALAYFDQNRIITQEIT